jgi:alanyl-tRNA synthetase
MDSASIRQSYLDFFQSKAHKVVPSASLLPTAPNLLFTNAGMNPFVPYFLGDRESPNRRVADTQKCIRAGGKHNDLEDVGIDTYHHTFFEMLGNWSFGDYFKKEAIEWAWELLTKVWKLPKERLYVSVYQPGPKDPASFDQEAYDHWKALLERDGIDPAVHIVMGGKKDNFWMMGDTGPCGPCSEVHIDLTENGDSKGKLVNGDSPFCMEIWNLVFIQFNATPDGQFVPLAHKHVDTGMGLERVAGIFATTRNLTSFGRVPSNYDSDLFQDVFQAISSRCGARYLATVPADKLQMSEQEQVDVRMRALADHLRAVCFAIGDGILPGNEGRNYVIRHILRRGVLAARRLGMRCGDFAALVPGLVAKMQPVFPGLGERLDLISKVIGAEEESFYKTLEKGLQVFERLAASGNGAIAGADAFTLYDTFGFPPELTQMMARERGLSVDMEGFEVNMQAQRERARASQKKSLVLVNTGETLPTHFDGYAPANWVNYPSRLLRVLDAGDGASFLVFESTPFYGEKGGQVGDTGWVESEGLRLQVSDTRIDPQGLYLHRVESAVEDSLVGSEFRLNLDVARRKAIQRHHSATHLLHWALRKVVGSHVHQAGSLVTPDRLRFDFSHFEKVSAEQLAEIERLVIEKILSNDVVETFETPFDQKPSDVLAFFEDKYGDVVRVVDMGGYSKELCAGTHTRTTGEIGFLKVVQESAIAAGSRRIEAVAGEAFQQWFQQVLASANEAAHALKCALPELGQRTLALGQERKVLEKELADLRSGQAGRAADALVRDASRVNGIAWVLAKIQVANANDLRGMAVRIQKELGESVVLLGSEIDGKLSLVCACSPAAVTAGHKAGEWLNRALQPLGGKGGGKPDFAMGGAPDAKSLEAVLEQLRQSALG